MNENVLKLGNYLNADTYDKRERIWNPLRCRLFQRTIGNEHRPFTALGIRKLLIDALAASGLTDVEGQPLSFWQHDFAASSSPTRS